MNKQNLSPEYETAFSKWQNDKTFREEFNKNPAKSLSSCGVELSSPEKAEIEKLSGNLKTAKNSKEMESIISSARLGTPLRNFLMSLY